MKVKLLEHSKLSNTAIATRTAWDSFHKGGNYTEPTDKISEDDIKLIKRVALKFKHASTLEQLTYNISIKGISRALLQQWSRSRLISQTVKSTRYVSGSKMALKKTQDKELNEFIEEYFIELLNRFGHLSNDVIKYGYPEAITTDLIVQVNARELRHIFSLRTKKDAMQEYRELMFEIYQQLPKEHRFLYEEYIYE